jgi:hypothetical protein
VGWAAGPIRAPPTTKGSSRNAVDVSQQQNNSGDGRPASSSDCGRDEPGVAEGQLCTGTTGGGRQSGLGSRFPARWYRFDPELRTSFASRTALVPFAARWAEMHVGGECLPVSASLSNVSACPRPKQATGSRIRQCRALHVTQTRQQRTSQSCTRRLHAASICKVFARGSWASTSATGVQRSSILIRQSGCHTRGH